MHLKEPDCGVAYIYFDYREQDKQLPIHVLAVLVKQLAIQATQLGIPECLVELEAKKRQPTVEELYTTLLDVSRLFPRTFLIFDALDECDPERQRKELLPLFHRLGKDGLKVFLTSRPHPKDIQNSLQNASKIKLFAHEEDIRRYIEHEIRKDNILRIIPREIEETIISTLVELTGEM